MNGFEFGDGFGFGKAFVFVVFDGFFDKGISNIFWFFSPSSG
jgi:hypothetical protein